MVSFSIQGWVSAYAPGLPSGRGASTAKTAIGYHFYLWCSGVAGYERWFSERQSEQYLLWSHSDASIEGGQSQSLEVASSAGATARTESNFDTIGVARQFVWLGLRP
jgi:hypothetical protein